MSEHDRQEGVEASRRSVIVSTLGITQTLAWASTYYLQVVFADRIADDLHLPREWFFAVFSSSLLLSGLLGPAGGRAIDKFGGRDVLALTNLVFAAGLVLLSLAGGFASLGAPGLSSALEWASVFTKQPLSLSPDRGARTRETQLPASRCLPGSPAP